MTPAQGRRGAFVRWLPALAWMGLIFLLSAQSGLRVSEDARVDEPLRVVAHLGTYAILGGLLLLALTARMPLTAQVAALAFGLAVVYGVTDEIHQTFVPERAGEVSDILTDAIGTAVGVSVAWWILQRARQAGTPP